LESAIDWVVAVNRAISSRDLGSEPYLHLAERGGYNSAVNDEATYTCGACGEEIVVPIDFSQGEEQEYVEDCPVCCQANVIHVEIDEEGEARVWAELE
jgi:cysteine-rich CPXCG protein